MSKRKQKWFKLDHYATPSLDNEVQCYTRIDPNLLTNAAVKDLSHAEFRVLIALICRRPGKDSFPYSKAAKDYNIPESTFNNALKSLAEKGFIRVASGKSSMQESTITFVDDWKTRNPDPKHRKARGNPDKLKHR